MINHLAEPRRLRYRRGALLLGAGASYDHGYPLVGDFLSDHYYRWLFDQCAALPASFGEAKLDYFLTGVGHIALLQTTLRSSCRESTGSRSYMPNCSSSSVAR